MGGVKARTAALPLLLVLTGLSIGAKSPTRDMAGLRELDEALPRYRTALLQGGADFGALAATFEDLAQSRPGRIAAWARLVAADCYVRAGRQAAAIAIWQDVSRQAPDLAGYCQYKLGGKSAVGAVASNVTLGSFAPDLLLAAAEAEADPAKAAELWKRAAEQAPQGSVAEQALYALATRGPEPRGPVAARYLRAFPSGEHLAEVARSLSPTGLGDSQRMELAGILMDRGEYARAANLLEGSPSGLAAYRLGRCYWRLGFEKRANALLIEAQRRSPELEQRIALTRAEMALGQKKWDQALTHGRKASKDPGPIGLDGLNLLVKVYLRSDRDAEAGWVDREIISRYPESDAADDARWRALWKAYRDGRMEDARAWAQGLSTHEGTLALAGTYWLGRFEQSAGRTSSALALYNRVAKKAPLTYYGWRARFRGAALSGRGDDPGFGIVTGPVAVRRPDPRGLLPEREREALGVSLDTGPSDADSLPGDLRVLAYLGLAPAARLPVGKARALVATLQGDYFRAITWAGDDPLLGNPLGYWPALDAAARSNGLDPLFFAALVKQESYFDPKSRSWVGAMGLAQLMPFTAEWVGRQIGESRKSLTDPTYNLKLGAWYLGYTGKVFEDHPILQTASYNAGVGAVKRWRKFYGNDLEAFIERIPFRETRHYVKKVYGYYWTYRALYRDQGGLAD